MAEGRRGSIVKTIAGGGIGLLSLYFFLLFFRDSGNLERFLEEKTQVAFREMLWLFAYLFLCLMGFFLKRKMQNAPGKGVFLRREASGEAINRAFLSYLFLLFILPTLVFAYLHRMLLPMLVSGLWFFVLALLFRFITTGRPLQIFKDFKRFLAFLEKDFQEGALYPLVFALPFFILQMNRSNVALDYDSLRYGLRSAYVLFPEGFFSAHGQINSVYSYPKGLELLTYPLNYLPGYGFLLSFSLWTYLALALVFGLLLFHFQKNRKKLYLGILCFFLLSSVGNMSLTMKTDLFTLLLQLSALYFFLKRKRLQSCFLLFFSYSFKPTAVVFSTLLGIVFLLTMLLEFLGKSNTKTNTKENLNINANTGINSNTNHNTIQAKGEKWTSELPFVLFSLVYTGLITLRTFLITGLPFSTTFTGIFKAIGFHVNWPFNLDAHVDYSGELSFSESAFSFFRRLFSFLFYPVGEDMEHVAIAWSGVLFPLILLFALWQCFSIGRKCLPGKNSLPGGNSLLGRNSSSGREAFLCRGSDDASPWDYLPLSLSFLVIMAFSLLSFVMLWQIDGNYYILWESLALLLCFSGGNLQENNLQEENAQKNLQEERPQEENAQKNLQEERLQEENAQKGLMKTNTAGSKGFILLLKAFFFFPFYLAAFLSTITTSWAGAVGFTPIDLANKGYYDHALVELENQGEKGSLPAFLEMTKNPRHHVLAFAEMPECYRIPCNVQSITDVEGSGGSPGLYDSPLYFAWFLKWSNTDYVYLEQSFLHDEREERAREMLLQMAEEGIFQSPMLVEKNKILPLDGVKAFSESNGEGAEQLLLLQIRKERLEYPWEERPYPELSPEEQMEKDRIIQLLSEYLQ
ncbi:Flp pilus assembly protein TadB [Oribacterium sinus]|uniref:Flp pilus assembly protein TadB n=1 Tax=Oribacterium sinus TaxID=237576 RepID=A0A7W9W2D6_9FIRM|nr:hypothetical protein [Oribacterium sinus]MBB6041840.1 Flp pilus assembly protein TadB [Oribacterium sinus]